jgi:hypothetical protein
MPIASSGGTRDQIPYDVTGVPPECAQYTTHFTWKPSESEGAPIFLFPVFVVSYVMLDEQIAVCANNVLVTALSGAVREIMGEMFSI